VATDASPRKTIDGGSVTGGHFGRGLGVVELTHRDPLYLRYRRRDRPDLGRRPPGLTRTRFLTAARDGASQPSAPAAGLSASPSAPESDYDPFGAANSSTRSPRRSAMAVAARSLRRPRTTHRRDRDGAMSAGMALKP